MDTHALAGVPKIGTRRGGCRTRQGPLSTMLQGNERHRDPTEARGGSRPCPPRSSWLALTGTWRRCPLRAYLACSRTFLDPSAGGCCKAPSRQTARAHQPQRTATDAATRPARRPGIRRSFLGAIPRLASISSAPSTPPRPTVAHLFLSSFLNDFCAISTISATCGRI